MQASSSSTKVGKEPPSSSSSSSVQGIKKVLVKKSVPTKSAKPQGSGLLGFVPAHAPLLLSGLPSTVTQDQVFSAVEKFGKTRFISLAEHRQEATVYFLQATAAQALLSFTELKIGGNPITVTQSTESVSPKLTENQASTKPASKAPPGNKTTSPGDKMTTPGNKTTTPGDKTTSPGDKTTTPGDNTTTPGDKATSPGDKTTTPGDKATTPGDKATSPGDKTTTPGDKATTPGDKTTTPGDKTTSPGDKTTSPGDKMMTTPGNEMSTNKTTMPSNKTVTPDSKLATPSKKSATPINTNMSIDAIVSSKPVTTASMPSMSLPPETTPCSPAKSYVKPIECIKVRSWTLADCYPDAMLAELLMSPPPVPLLHPGAEVSSAVLFFKSIKCIDVRSWTLPDFQAFASCGATIMVTGLPNKVRGRYREPEMTRVLEMFGKTKCDKRFILPDNRMAFVELGASKMERLMDALGNGVPMDGGVLRCHLLKEYALSSPIAFYKQLLEWSEKIYDETTLEYRLVYISNFPTNKDNWVETFHEGITKTGGVRLYLPLMGKIFVEFVTVEDADRFGIWLSNFRPIRLSKSSFRVTRPGLIPDTDATTPVRTRVSSHGSEDPFWMVVAALPRLYPTLSPQFYTPAHRTVNGPEDIGWADMHLTGQSVVMVTGLPLGGYSHMDLLIEAWPYFVEKDISLVFYHVVILPLQRRAFIYFDDGLKCKEFVSDYLHKPFTIGGCDLTLHFLLQHLKPCTTELQLYKQLLQWSNVVPEQTVTRNLLLLTEMDYCSMKALKFIFNAMWNIHYISCLVLANRVRLTVVPLDSASAHDQAGPLGSGPQPPALSQEMYRFFATAIRQHRQNTPQKKCEESPAQVSEADDTTRITTTEEVECLPACQPITKDESPSDTATVCEDDVARLGHKMAAETSAVKSAEVPEDKDTILEEEIVEEQMPSTNDEIPKVVSEAADALLNSASTEEDTHQLMDCVEGAPPKEEFNMDRSNKEPTKEELNTNEQSNKEDQRSKELCNKEVQINKEEPSTKAQSNKEVQNTKEEHSIKEQSNKEVQINKEEPSTKEQGNKEEQNSKEPTEEKQSNEELQSNKEEQNSKESTEKEQSNKEPTEEKKKENEPIEEREKNKEPTEKEQSKKAPTEEEDNKDPAVEEVAPEMEQRRSKRGHPSPATKPLSTRRSTRRSTPTRKRESPAEDPVKVEEADYQILDSVEEDASSPRGGVSPASGALIPQGQPHPEEDESENQVVDQVVKGVQLPTRRKRGRPPKQTSKNVQVKEQPTAPVGEESGKKPNEPLEIQDCPTRTETKHQEAPEEKSRGKEDGAEGTQMADKATPSNAKPRVSGEGICLEEVATYQVLDSVEDEELEVKAVPPVTRGTRGRGRKGGRAQKAAKAPTRKDCKLSLEESMFEVLDSIGADVVEEAPEQPGRPRRGLAKKDPTPEKDEKSKHDDTPEGTHAKQDQDKEEEEVARPVVDSEKSQGDKQPAAGKRRSGRWRKEEVPVFGTSKMAAKEGQQRLEEEEVYQVVDSIENKPHEEEHVNSSGPRRRSSSQRRDPAPAKTRASRTPAKSTQGEEPLYQVVDSVGAEEDQVPVEEQLPGEPMRGKRGRKVAGSDSTTGNQATKKKKTTEQIIPPKRKEDGGEKKATDAGEKESQEQNVLVSLDEVSEEEDYLDDSVEEEELRKMQAVAEEEEDRRREEEEERNLGAGMEGLVTLDEIGEEKEEEGGRREAGITEGELQALVTLDKIVEEEPEGEEPTHSEHLPLLPDDQSEARLDTEMVCDEEKVSFSIVGKCKQSEEQAEEGLSFVTLDEVGYEEEEETQTHSKKERMCTRGGEQQAPAEPSGQEALPTPLHATSPLACEPGAVLSDKAAEPMAESPARDGEETGVEEHRLGRKASSKARREEEGAEPKRVRALSPTVANDYTLPPFTPHNPLGMEHVVPKVGFYCNLCSVFYEDETRARTLHCSSLGHYHNLKKHYQRLQEEQSRSQSGGSAPGNAPRRL
ncbi:unnamed protein product [Lota lota]